MDSKIKVGSWSTNTRLFCSNKHGDSTSHQLWISPKPYGSKHLRLEGILKVTLKKHFRRYSWIGKICGKKIPFRFWWGSSEAENNRQLIKNSDLLWTPKFEGSLNWLQYTFWYLLVKILKAKENVTHKCGPKILTFFHVLPNFSFITWGTEHYY